MGAATTDGVLLSGGNGNGADGSNQMASSNNPPTYLNHHNHHGHNQAPQTSATSAPAAAAGPYQFVPFPHRPYPYDLLSLAPMGQSMYNNKMAEHAQAAKYRDTLGRTSSTTQLASLPPTWNA